MPDLLDLETADQDGYLDPTTATTYGLPYQWHVHYNGEWRPTDLLLVIGEPKDHDSAPCYRPPLLTQGWVFGMDDGNRVLIEINQRPSGSITAVSKQTIHPGEFADARARIESKRESKWSVIKPGEWGDTSEIHQLDMRRGVYAGASWDELRALIAKGSAD